MKLFMDPFVEMGGGAPEAECAFYVLLKDLTDIEATVFVLFRATQAPPRTSGSLEFSE